MSSPAERSAHVLSFLKPEECAEHGLPGVAVQGEFTDDEFTVAGFRVNPAFVEFMHDVIRTQGATDPSLQQAAAKQKNGWLYIIDLRTPDGPQGRVPMEDIVGAFQVADGRLLPESYWANEKHEVLTENGPVHLPWFLREALVRSALERARSMP